MKPIPDRAEVSLDFPEKAYMGAFGHAARFEAHARADQVVLRLLNDGGEKRVVEIHIHLSLLAEILDDLAGEFANAGVDEVHRAKLADAAGRLSAALGGGGA